MGISIEQYRSVIGGFGGGRRAIGEKRDAGTRSGGFCGFEEDDDYDRSVIKYDALKDRRIIYKVKD